MKFMDAKKIRRKQFFRYILSGLLFAGGELCTGLFYRQKGITEIEDYIRSNHPDEWAKITQRIKEED